ncbi:hypothetical protein ACGF07_33015 [Kitasatospora sp. NPDC048194]|uniref:ATP-dependent DNA ligase n=1 Tax=Kitasatospora sp. NPDC048194 TaxID=3364045 RepID=UPI003714291C
MAPFDLPIGLALARPIDRLPASAGRDRAEPKLDGWRGLLAAGPAARLYSRHGTDLSRAFSDVVPAAAELPPCVLDGEVIAVLRTGALSFARLQTRSGKGPKPGADFTVQFAAFDALADDTDRRPLPYLERHELLLGLLENAPPTIWPVPMTDNLDQAKAWFKSLGGGVEGCVSKPAARSWSRSRRRPRVSRAGRRPAGCRAGRPRCRAVRPGRRSRGAAAGRVPSAAPGRGGG